MSETQRAARQQHGRMAVVAAVRAPCCTHSVQPGMTRKPRTAWRRWRGVEFVVRRFKETKDVFILGQVDDVLQVRWGVVCAAAPDKRRALQWTGVLEACCRTRRCWRTVA